MEIISAEVIKKASKYLIATLVSPWWTLKLTTPTLKSEPETDCPNLLFKTKFKQFVFEDNEDNDNRDLSLLRHASEGESLVMCGLHACCALDLRESLEGETQDISSKSLFHDYSKKNLIEEFLQYGTQDSRVPMKITASALKLLAGSVDSSFWSVDGNSIVTLNSQDFNSFLSSKKHALVIFYSPSCRHCQKAKPEFVEASRAFKKDKNIVFAAVDCTQEPELCRSNRIVGYPTMIYFRYSQRRREYDGHHKAKDIINFMNKPVSFDHNHKVAVAEPLSKHNECSEDTPYETHTIGADMYESICQTV